MYEIGNVDGTSVMMIDKLKNLNVIEISYNEILNSIKSNKIYNEIKNTKDYCQSSLIYIPTWEEKRKYKGIEYKVILIRGFSLEYCKTSNDIKFKINEEYNCTYFKFEFVGKSINFRNFYNENLKDEGFNFIYGISKNKNYLINQIECNINHAIEKIPIFIINADKEIQNLTEKIKQIRQNKRKAMEINMEKFK